MEQYINKDALVAEINRILSAFENSDAPVDRLRASTLIGLLSFIDTLEVKELDLEKEVDNFYGMYRKDGQTFSLEDNKECVDWKVDCNPNFEKAFAKHFFELGMQTKEGNVLVKAKGFLVRDLDDYTAIYSTKPNRGETEWFDANHPRNVNESSYLFAMNARLLPNVEFDDEPIEVEVTITKKGE